MLKILLRKAFFVRLVCIVVVVGFVVFVIHPIEDSHRTVPSTVVTEHSNAIAASSDAQEIPHACRSLIRHYKSQRLSLFCRLVIGTTEMFITRVSLYLVNSVLCERFNNKTSKQRLGKTNRYLSLAT
jgi:hypothetical protein